MAASTYVGDALLNWLKGSAYPAAPGSLYVSVHVADPGGAGSSGDVTMSVLNGRVQLPQADLGAPSASAGGGRQISNTAPLVLTNSALAPVTLTHFGIWSASTAGNFLVSGQLAVPVVVLIGDVLRIAAGQLVIPVR